MTADTPGTGDDEDSGETAAIDRFHDTHAEGGLQSHLWAMAFGGQHPAEVDPSSSCTWAVLGHMVAGLRLRPDAVLVDLGCGRGGVGLWLARAFSAYLIGIDRSPRGLEIAAGRAPSFLPEGRARFQKGTFERTGLPESCADGAVSMDALPFAPDRDAALRELGRILRPGARAVFTGIDKHAEHPRYDPGAPSWQERIARSGLDLIEQRERPEEPGLWIRLYELWEKHEAQLRAEIGEDAAEDLLTEARKNKPIMKYRRALLLTVSAPA